MKPKWSQKLSTLTKLTSTKRKFKLTQVEQEAFEKIKRIVDHDTLLTYTDFNEKFNIHTDGSTF